MHRSHSQAKNLFSRLFSYVPKDKGNETIENYITEALAWCLIHSTSFAREFLKLCELQLGDEEISVEIHTQNSFNDEEDDFRGQFDLVIISYYDPKFVVAVESKVWSHFHPSQLPTYKQRLQSEYFKDIPEDRRRLVTLTPTGEPKMEAHTNIKWSQVQSLLMLHTKSHPAEQAVVMLEQFADFLKENGLAPLELMKITQQLLEQWPAFGAIQQDLERILINLQSQAEIKKLSGRKKKVEFEKCRLLLIRGRLAASFCIAPVGGIPELFMMVEILFDGDRRELTKVIRPELKEAYQCASKHLEAMALAMNDASYKSCANLNLLVPDGDTWFSFSKTIGSELSEQPGKILEWLYDTSKAAITFHNENKSKGKKSKRM